MGVAGGGASSLATRTPQELVFSAYSWIVHIVWSSLGSTLVYEWLPQGVPFDGSVGPALYAADVDV